MLVRRETQKIFFINNLNIWKQPDSGDKMTNVTFLYECNS